MGKIKEGQDAPSFKLNSYNKGLIDLDQLIGKQKIVLIFSRYFGCPLCQLDWKNFLGRINEITAKGAIVLYITQSREDIAKKFIDEGHVDFPVIHSTKDELYNDYGLGMMSTGTIAKVPKMLKEAKKEGIEHGEYEGYEKQNPGQFVIDEQGKIIHAQKGWLDVDAILAVL